MGPRGPHRSSPYVVDQVGLPLLLLTVLVCALIGLSFRYFFSSERLSRELRLAFEKMSREARVGFGSAQLSLSNSWGLPGLSLEIEELDSELLLPGLLGSRVKTNYLRVPLSFWEIVTRRFALSQVVLDHVEMDLRLPSWELMALSEQKHDVPSDGPIGQQSMQASSVRDGLGASSEFHLRKPQPVEEIDIDTLEFKGDWARWGLVVRSLRFEIVSPRESQIRGELFFRYDPWQGHLRKLDVFIRIFPDQQMVSVKISGKDIQGGLWDLRLQWDKKADFYSVDGRIEQGAFAIIQILNQLVDGRGLFKAGGAEWEAWSRRLSDRAYARAKLSAQFTLMGYPSSVHQGWQLSVAPLQISQEDGVWLSTDGFMLARTKSGQSLSSVRDLSFPTLTLRELKNILRILTFPTRGESSGKPPESANRSDPTFAEEMADGYALRVLQSPPGTWIFELRPKVQPMAQGSPVPTMKIQSTSSHMGLVSQADWWTDSSFQWVDVEWRTSPDETDCQFSAEKSSGQGLTLQGYRVQRVKQQWQWQARKLSFSSNSPGAELILERLKISRRESDSGALAHGEVYIKRRKRPLEMTSADWPCFRVEGLSQEICLPRPVEWLALGCVSAAFVR